MKVRRRNWAGNQRCVPASVHQPRSTAEVAGLVREAAERGERVKVIGGGHSFTGVAMTDGRLLSLDAMNAVLSVSGTDVTVQAGIRLHELNDQLARHGLAMPNLGDIDRQSIAGATSTATHGTGRGFGNLATTIVAMEMVTGDGSVLRLDEGDELLRVAAVGLGALGIVTEVTLRLVPAFNIHAHETIEVLDDILHDFEAVMSGTDHVEFFWIPGTRRCQVKRNTHTDRAAEPQSKYGYVRDKWIGENLAFGTVCRVGRRYPHLAPRISKLVATAAAERQLVDRSDRIFCSPRRVRFLEMEYGIPLRDVPEAMSRIREFIPTLSFPPLFPIEVRSSAADDIALSTANGRESGWIAIHQYIGTPYEEYFQGVEEIMGDYAGRPHWGKLHFRSAANLAEVYPEWDTFRRHRSELDPDGRFRNAHLDRVLGVP